MVISVQSYLAKTQEGLVEAINKLELQVTKILMKIEYIKIHMLVCGARYYNITARYLKLK